MRSGRTGLVSRNHFCGGCYKNVSSQNIPPLILSVVNANWCLRLTCISRQFGISRLFVWFQMLIFKEGTPNMNLSFRFSSIYTRKRVSNTLKYIQFIFFLDYTWVDMQFCAWVYILSFLGYMPSFLGIILECISHSGLFMSVSHPGSTLYLSLYGFLFWFYGWFYMPYFLEFIFEPICHAF